jgi:hypothetical protein
MLHHKEAESIVRKIVADILDNVRTPERVRSPIGFYMTEQEQFQEKNPDVRSFLNQKKSYSSFFSL